jgi:acetoin utilization deacetylase AcuC-like enzyme
VPITIIEPVAVTADDIGLAHDSDYVRGVLNGVTSNGFGNKLPEVAAALPYTSGAMVAAARAAIANGSVAVAPVSGFHHATYEHGGGYCTFNGLMVAAMMLEQEGVAEKVGILDFDQHYSNGTDDIIRYLGLD